jgi:holliday junction DNA helicase RuvA
MYHHLSGKLAHKSPAQIVVDVGGIGYELAVPLSTFEKLPPEGDAVLLLTHLHVRDDGMRLFGFLSHEERELFRMLLTVSGIGPMLAMAVLSGSSVEAVKGAVLAGDAVRLRKIRGIGTKTAERMVLELRDPIARLGVRVSTGSAASGEFASIDAVSALVSLGFSRARADEAVALARKTLGTQASVEALVREALKSA